LRHVVSLSGGLSSAVAASRVIHRYGKEATTLWFADTLWEDEDLYRFLEDLEKWFGMTIVHQAKGITPLQVAENNHIIPCNFMALCSKELKQWECKKLLKGFEKPVTLHLGLDWTEEHRTIAPKSAYEQIKGVIVDFPLLWIPFEPWDYDKVVESWGIKIPRLYKLGFSHNNCGGRCVRQGAKEWVRLYRTFPERYREVAKWEREHTKGRSILESRKGGVEKPLFLDELEMTQGEYKLDMLGVVEDHYACLCSY
jgi:3'-phosphoadenosine 5'-phosphosulfate sulfotransferase (PAPS reductase)/FAD synthetase